MVEVGLERLTVAVADAADEGGGPAAGRTRSVAAAGTGTHAGKARASAALGGRIKDPTDTVILNNTSHLINEAINTLKDISNNLSPHILSNFGLSSALSAFIAKINQTKAIEIEFKSNMENTRLDPEKEVVMYRAACELINNSIRHSGASRIEIDLNKLEKFITLQFSDNGRGFDMAFLNTDDNTRGMGLSNIDTRVKSVDGVFILESNPGKGTSALIKMLE